MSRPLGQQIFIDDKGGAGGAVGTRRSSKARPTTTRRGSPGRREVDVKV
jgi:tripartite-type tricarboxylate transporter receptor subunit TctC